MKTKGHLIVLLAVLLVLGMIVSPVCASTYTPTANLILDSTPETFQNVWNLSYDASINNERISQIEFSTTTAAYTNFTLFYGAGNTVDGSTENHIISFLPPTTRSTVTLNGVSKSYDYIDTLPLQDFYFTGYARDDMNQTGILAYSVDYGLYDNDLAVFFPVSDITANTIYRVDMSSPDPITVTIRHAPTASVASNIGKSAIETAGDWISFGISIAGQVLAFALMFFGLIKFFFIDNLLLIIALWIGVTMAYSAMSTRNIFQFYTKFFRYQRSLLDFIILLWKWFIQIISSFRGIFRL